VPAHAHKLQLHHTWTVTKYRESLCHQLAQHNILDKLQKLEDAVESYQWSPNKLKLTKPWQSYHRGQDLCQIDSDLLLLRPIQMISETQASSFPSMLFQPLLQTIGSSSNFQQSPFRWGLFLKQLEKDHRIHCQTHLENLVKVTAIDQAPKLVHESMALLWDERWEKLLEHLITRGCTHQFFLKIVRLIHGSPSSG
jgi:hypothetical protein